MVETQLETTVEDYVASRREYILRHASTTNQDILEHWFYSIAWDHLNAHELTRVHDVLAADTELQARMTRS